MRRSLVILSLLAAVSALGACGPGSQAGSGSDALAANSWRAVEVSGKPVPANLEVTLSFADGRVSGNSGCNNYGGDATATGDSLRVSAIMSTKMACLEPGVMETEMTYLQALQGAERWAVGGDGQLVISGAKGEIRLTPVAPQKQP